MANTRDIRRRIKSVKNTAQITRAMQLVAASKMKKAQDVALEGRPYTELLAEMLSSLGERLIDYEHPFLESRSVKKRGILVVSTDKGLCGALNANLFRKLTKIEGSASFVSIGRKAAQFLSRTQRELLADFTISDKVHFAEVRSVVEFLIQSYREGKIDTLEVVYTHFVNTMVQNPVILPLLPFRELKSILQEKDQEAGRKSASEDTREILFEPGPAVILDELLNLYIKQEIYHVVLEAKASEHSSRMVAMKTATDNANTLVDDLTLDYNKVRQAAITQEILEISAASFAN